MQRAPIVKKHLERALELNPSDATTWHILGIWCFTFADLPWYQRKIASALFASPPESDYQSALANFLKAEAVSPNFYSTNLLMLGKTYLRLNDKNLAREYLVKARNYVVMTKDDQDAHDEAEKLLKSL